jgi:hypothetical protein
MITRNRKFTAKAGVATFAALLAFGSSTAFTAAYAQSPADATLPADSTTTTANIDEAKLDKFVSAYSEVLQLQKEANEKQSTTADPAANQALANETQSKMTTAVQRSGLEIDEFNQIAQQMLKDEDLRSRIAAKLQMRGNVTGG